MSNNKFASKCSENVANIISVWKVNKCLTPYLAVTTVVITPSLCLKQSMNSDSVNYLKVSFFKIILVP